MQEGLNIISIDPSAAGTTGICLIKDEIVYFFDDKDFTSKEWKEHIEKIVDLVKEQKPTQLLYEHTNWIHAFGKEALGVFKIFGAIEATGNCFNIKTGNIPANQVKELKEKIRKGEIEFDNLFYKKHVGWKYMTNKISEHQVDAFLVYQLWLDKGLFSKIRTKKGKGKIG